MRARRGPWRVLGSREVYRNPWIRVREDRVLRPDGKPGIYGVVETTPAVGVVALTPDRRVYLVGQHRYPLDEYSWEIITGDGDEHEDALLAAKRELLEEAGLSAERWTALGRCHVSNSVTNQVGCLYLAEDLTEGEARPDETEALTVRTVPLSEALAMAQASDVVQAFSLVGLYRAWHYLHASAGAAAFPVGRGEGGEGL